MLMHFSIETNNDSDAADAESEGDWHDEPEVMPTVATHCLLQRQWPH